MINMPAKIQILLLINSTIGYAFTLFTVIILHVVPEKITTDISTTGSASLLSNLLFRSTSVSHSVLHR